MEQLNILSTFYKNLGCSHLPCKEITLFHIIRNEKISYIPNFYLISFLSTLASEFDYFIKLSSLIKSVPIIIENVAFNVENS